VKGRRLDTEGGIRTRARAREQAERWHMVPAPARILALLADTLLEAREGAPRCNRDCRLLGGVYGGAAAGARRFTFLRSCCDGSPSPEAAAGAHRHPHTAPEAPQHPGDKGSHG